MIDDAEEPYLLRVRLLLHYSPKQYLDDRWRIDRSAVFIRKFTSQYAWRSDINIGWMLIMFDEV
jgi:hypothetical protein